MTSTLGLVSLVDGFTRAESNGWSDSTTIGLFVASAVLLAAFVFTESKVKAPLLPLRVITERNRWRRRPLASASRSSRCSVCSCS